MENPIKMDDWGAHPYFWKHLYMILFSFKLLKVAGYNLSLGQSEIFIRLKAIQSLNSLQSRILR